MKTKKIKIIAATRRCGDAAKKHSTISGLRLASRLSFAVNQILIFAVLFSILLSFACTPRSFEKPNVAAPPPAANAEDKQANFQNEVEKMRTANLQYIFVFRRKDGGAFDGENKKYLRANLPFNNRVVLADEDRAVIVGSNYKFPPENLDALRTQFNVEDYSAPEPAKTPEQAK